jgi:hypothetical protein
MSAHHDALRQSLIGIRTALSMLIYTPENTGWLSRVDTNHHAGGVMDHLASLIDSLAPEHESLGDPEWSRPSHFPAPHDPVQGSDLTPAQVADGWHYCPAFDDLLTQGENHSGDHCLCGHPNRVF